MVTIPPLVNGVYQGRSPSLTASDYAAYFRVGDLYRDPTSWYGPAAARLDTTEYSGGRLRAFATPTWAGEPHINTSTGVSYNWYGYSVGVWVDQNGVIRAVVPMRFGDSTSTTSLQEEYAFLYPYNGTWKFYLFIHDTEQASYTPIHMEFVNSGSVIVTGETRTDPGLAFTQLGITVVSPTQPQSGYFDFTVQTKDASGANVSVANAIVDLNIDGLALGLAKYTNSSGNIRIVVNAANMALGTHTVHAFVTTDPTSNQRRSQDITVTVGSTTTTPPPPTGPTVTGLRLTVTDANQTTAENFEFFAQEVDSTGANIAGPSLPIDLVIDTVKLGRATYTNTSGVARLVVAANTLTVGTHEVRAIVASDPTTATRASTIVMITVSAVAPPPTSIDLNVAISLQQSTAAVPTDIIATSTVSGGTPPYTYQWQIGGGGEPLVIATSANVSTHIGVPGTYTVNLFVNDAAGNAGSNGVVFTATGSGGGTGGTPGPGNGGEWIMGLLGGALALGVIGSVLKIPNFGQSKKKTKKYKKPPVHRFSTRQLSSDLRHAFRTCKTCRKQGHICKKCQMKGARG